MLAPTSRPCVATAFTLYSRILDEIEGSGFAVFARRARVGRLRRVAVAGPGLARALWVRRPGSAAVTAGEGW
jgi:phytoene synthase